MHEIVGGRFEFGASVRESRRSVVVWLRDEPLTTATESETAERILQVLAADDSVEREWVLAERATVIGRAAGGVDCPDDLEMADRHAQVCVKDGAAVIRDTGKGSGVWLRVVGSQGRRLESGDQVWLGAQILIIHREDEVWQIRHHGPDGRFRETYSLPTGGLLLGRDSELILDPDDSRLSRRHAQLVPEGGELRLYDRGAHNGTYIKIVDEESLSDGDEFRIASHRFRVVLRDAPGIPQSNPEPLVVPATQREAPRRVPGLAKRLRSLGRRSEEKALKSRSRGLPVDDATVLSSNAGEATDVEIVEQESPPIGKKQETAGGEKGESVEKVLIVIDSDGGSVSLEVSPGKTILDAVQEAGLPRGEPVDWECSDGGCGVCVVEVLEGADRMAPPDPAGGEMKTIQITEQVVPDPRRYRLACRARVHGTIRLRKLS